MKCNIRLNFFLFLLISTTLFGQIKENDLTHMSFQELKSSYFSNSTTTDNKIKYANACVKKAHIERNKIQIAKGYYWFSLLYTDNNFQKSISYLDSVIKYSANTNDLYFPNAAYCEKAELLKKQLKFKEALSNYLIAEKYSIANNKTDDLYIIKFYIAKTKSEDLGEVNEALTIYKECFNFYKNKNYRDSKYSSNYQYLLFGLADVYKTLTKTDSASYYNRKGYIEAKATNNQEMLYIFVLNEGANQVVKNNFNVALDSVKKALPKIIENKDVFNVMASYYYLGKIYLGKKNREKAKLNFIKVDSIYKKTKTIYPEFIEGYTFLISYYKGKNDKENQLIYLNTFLEIQNNLQKNYKQLDKILVKEYDFPHMVIEKENLITSLKSDKKKYYWGISTLLILLIVLIVYLLHQKNINKKYKIRFEEIISNKDNSNKNNLKVINENQERKEIGVSKELINQILEKLNNFEIKKQFLETNITVQSLSDEFETNNKYVSRVINEYKKKPFIQYVNDLRIDYAIETIQKDDKLRKYTISALASEFGFNNAESFSLAFLKKTGIKPSFFIKELEKQ